MIKQYIKDLTGFLLILVVGAIIGWLTTLTIQQAPRNISWSDIGGMLAGLSSTGLLVIALATLKSWQKQIKHQDFIHTVEEYCLEKNRLLSAILGLALKRDSRDLPRDEEEQLLEAISYHHDAFQQKLVKLNCKFKIDPSHGYQVLHLAKKIVENNHFTLGQIYKMRTKFAKVEQDFLKDVYS